MKRTLTFGALLAGTCILLAVVSISVTGCSSLANLNILNPTYSIRDVRPHVAIALPLSASTIDFDFTLGVDNPNPVGIRLARMDFGLLVNNNHILDSYSTERIRIPARGTGLVPLHARVGYNEIRSMFSEIADVIQGNRANYEIRGNAYWDTPAGQLKLPVTVYSNR